MNPFDLFSAKVESAVRSLDLFDGEPADLSRVTVEPPRDPDHGDIATNAALVLAKPAKQNPRAIAERLVAALETDADIASVEIAGPGFINVRLAPAIWQRQVQAVLKQGQGYGGGVLEPRKINVEYVSANPTGPMHVGHCRGAVVGDALANLLDFCGP